MSDIGHSTMGMKSCARYWIRRLLLTAVTCLLLLCVSATKAEPPGCDGVIDLVLILDESESIRDNDPVDKPGDTWSHLTGFSKTLVQNLPADTDTRVAMVQYGTTAKVTFELDQHSTSIKVQDAITHMSQNGGNTNTAHALRTVRSDVLRSSRGARSAARDVIVLVFDGMSNVETERTLDESKRLLDEGVEVFTVAATPYINTEELRAVSSEPVDTHFLHVASHSDLEDIVDLLVHRICHLPDPTPPPPADCVDGCAKCEGEVCVECVLGKYLQGNKCKDCLPHCDVCTDSKTCHICQLGWFWNGDYCEECELIADLALLVDVSGSIKDKNPKDGSYDNYEILKDFLKALVYRLEVHPDRIRIGAVRFSNFANLMFHLDEHATRATIDLAIDSMEYGGGNTNTSGAIRLMREEIFTREHGDRKGVPNVALVITDGESNRDRNQTLPQAMLGQGEGITFFVVGVTNEININEVLGIASDPDDQHYFSSPDIKNLDTILLELVRHVCDPRNSAFVDENSDDS